MLQGADVGVLEETSGAAAGQRVDDGVEEVGRDEDAQKKGGAETELQPSANVRGQPAKFKKSFVVGFTVATALTLYAGCQRADVFTM
ncbi:hypothetical protein PInf_028534 [Phytophthora infestans]|nr:hypothetical protein PInf_028534 [Phytophthora infestans]